MKIGNIRVRFAILPIAVFLILTFILLYTVWVTGDRNLLFWGILALVFILLIPLVLNYMSQHQYSNLIPVYEAQAKTVRVNQVNLSLLAEPVRLVGIVEKTHFQFLNRPTFVVGDRTGEISVKMFTAPAEKIRKGDRVEVLGQVIKRYVAAGEAVINAVSIRKLDPVTPVEAALTVPKKKGRRG
ncbi:MAG TPA: OB-fold nucleic acid binding domain-containing protein [Methanoregulaceae archaeon]|nr:OB-fold nucleic acid binding domain-containing protein [Methanoregulaceae archaeon]HQJ87482.1 OB-fold nucleic acid binding domain-containing protein [Methanoregulaceae archaeon]